MDRSQPISKNVLKLLKPAADNTFPMLPGALNVTSSMVLMNTEARRIT